MNSLKCLSARFVIDIGEVTVLEVVNPSLKCLSARFVIDIYTRRLLQRPQSRSCLKCLSARFVIDILNLDPRRGRGGSPGLKCLSARFVIDIHENKDKWSKGSCLSQMPFG